MLDVKVEELTLMYIIIYTKGIKLKKFIISEYKIKLVNENAGYWYSYKCLLTPTMERWCIGSVHSDQWCHNSVTQHLTTVCGV